MPIQGRAPSRKGLNVAAGSLRWPTGVASGNSAVCLQMHSSAFGATPTNCSRQLRSAQLVARSNITGCGSKNTSPNLFTRCSSTSKATTTLLGNQPSPSLHCMHMFDSVEVHALHTPHTPWLSCNMQLAAQERAREEQATVHAPCLHSRPPQLAQAIDTAVHQQVP